LFWLASSRVTTWSTSQAWARLWRAMTTKPVKQEELDDIEPLVPGDSAARPDQQLGAAIASSPATATAYLKWASLAALVVQNSSLFVVTRFSREVDPDSTEPLYLGSVVVLVVELCKLAFCTLVLGVEAGGAVGQLASRLHHDIVVERAETLKLVVPALCYTVQNNLVFVAISNLSAAAAQVLYQTKTLSTALFSVLILKKAFPLRQWLSFVLLAAGVVLVQSQDAKSHVARTGGSPLVGGLAALGAAGLSGFAGVYLELVFTKAGSSLFMRNIQLALFSIPLQAVAILQTDREAVLADGMMQGFNASTWAVVFIQFAGAMLTAVVIKYAGNILKTFATVLALLCTCFVSMLVFHFHPTPLFWLGVATVSMSVFLYSMKLPGT